MRLPREPLLPTTNKAQRGGGYSFSFFVRALFLVGGGVGLLYAGFTGMVGGAAQEPEPLEKSQSHVSSGVVGVEMVERENLLEAHVQQSKHEIDQPTLDFAQASTADVAAQLVTTKPESKNAAAKTENSILQSGGDGADSGTVSKATSTDPIAVEAQQDTKQVKALEVTGSDDTTTTEAGNSAAVVNAPAPVATGLYALSTKNIMGEMVSLGAYAGNVSIVVNVASRCGFTDTNYKGLEELYRQYKSRGFVVLGFPCNQFGAQEPGTNEDIKSFADSHYNVTFPLFAKTDVNGPNTDPIYKFLKEHLPASEGNAKNADFDLRWNFQKFLVDREGFPKKLFYEQFDLLALEPSLKELLDAPLQGTPS